MRQPKPKIAKSGICRRPMPADHPLERVRFGMVIVLVFSVLTYKVEVERQKRNKNTHAGIFCLYLKCWFDDKAAVRGGAELGCGSQVPQITLSGYGANSRI